LLFVSELIYISIAKKLNIIDKPNERSSHISPVVRGGGIIIIIAQLLFYLLNDFAFPYLLIAVIISATVSFIDDIKGLPSSIRFFSHLVSALLLILQVNLFSIPILIILIILILIIGIINAYNFMDGINGITGFYSIAIIFPLYLSESNQIIQTLEIYLTLALLTFLFFNARKKATCFAGDIGSISIAIIILFLLIYRINETLNLVYIAFLLVYGIDSILTIIQRLLKKENIFRAHRKHLYQNLSNEIGIPQLYISIFYGTIQLILNLIIIHFAPSLTVAIIFSLTLAIIYIIIKWWILKTKIHL